MGAARLALHARVEDVVAFLAQQMAKAPIARLMRIPWDSVGRIVERDVAEIGRSAGETTGLTLVCLLDSYITHGQQRHPVHQLERQHLNSAVF